MPDNAAQPAQFFTARDARRAVALLAHAQAGDGAGIRLILTEALQADEALDLAVAGAALTLDLIPGLRTEEGGKLLRALVAQLAAAEDAEAGL